jgi:hypothetical protein
VGVFRPSIVLPAWVLGASAETRHVILQHESEHIAAGDAGLLTTAAILVALMPWNVALWWQYLRLRATVETDCDARVLARGKTNVRQYGEVLLRVAARTTRIPALSPAMGRNMALIERRLLAMTAGPVRYQRAYMSAMTGAALLAMVTAAGASSTTIQLPEPLKIQIQSGELSLMMSGHMSVRLDMQTLGQRVPLFPSVASQALMGGSQRMMLSTLMTHQGPVSGVLEIRDLEINGTKMGPMTVPIRFDARQYMLHHPANADAP